MCANMPSKKGATPVRFELTRENPTGLAGQRLNHSAKVSTTISSCRNSLFKVGLIQVINHLLELMQTDLSKISFRFIVPSLNYQLITIPLFENNTVNNSITTLFSNKLSYKNDPKETNRSFAKTQTERC